MGDRVQGKSAIVTGAGSGIGRACAMRLAAEGATVVVNDIDGERAAAVVAEITAAGGAAVPRQADVSQSEQVESMVGFAIEECSALDILINNAAAPLPGSVADTPDDAWALVQSVTLNGTFYGVRAALRVMVPRGSGSIINISSGAGLRAVPFLAAYGAAKAGVINLTQTAAVENAATGVRVNAISPGAIATPPMLAWAENIPGGADAFAQQIPAKRLGQPEEIANMALFLASDESQYVTGTVMIVDGGVAAQLGAS